MCPDRQYMVIQDVTQLPSELSKVYRSLTAKRLTWTHRSCQLFCLTRFWGTNHATRISSAIPVHDLQLAAQFYEEVLGCKRGREDTQWIDFNLFGHQLVCHEVKGFRIEASHNPVDGHEFPFLILVSCSNLETGGPSGIGFRKRRYPCD